MIKIIGIKNNNWKYVIYDNNKFIIKNNNNIQWNIKNEINLI